MRPTEYLSAFLACLLLLSGCGTESYHLIDYVPQEGLVALYPFDGDGMDATRNELHAIVSEAQFGNNRFDIPFSAVVFDGVDDYVDVIEDTAFKIEPPLSIAYWIKLDQNTTTSTIFTSSFDAMNNSGVFATFNSNGGNPSFSIGDGGVLGRSSRHTVHANVQLEAGIWYHIVGVYTALREIDIYIDGVLVDTFSSGNASTLDLGAGPVTFGRRHGTSGQPPIFFKGALDEFAFYNRALTETEVQRLYTAGENR